MSVTLILVRQLGLHPDIVPSLEYIIKPPKTIIKTERGLLMWVHLFFFFQIGSLIFRSFLSEINLCKYFLYEYALFDFQKVEL